MLQSKFSSANFFYRDSDFAQATSLYKEALKDGVDGSFVYDNLGLSLLNSGRDEEAVGCFINAIIRDSKSISKKRLGKIISHSEDAIKIFEMRFENKMEIKNYVVDALWGGYSKQALMWLEKILYDTNESMENRFFAAWQAARWHYFEGDYSSALEKARDIVNFLDPGFSSQKMTTMIFVFSYINLNMYSEAKKVIKEFLKNRPHDGDAHFAISNVYRKLGNDEDRLKYINRVYSNKGMSLIKKIDASRNLSLDNIISYAEKIEREELVSVIMPVYNSDKTLPYAVNSLLNQSWKNIEIIIVDDCSTDATFDIAKSYEEKDSRVTAIKKQKNSGAYDSRNLGLKYAKGDFITTHDGDDWSHPQKIEKQVEFLQNKKNIMGVCTHWIRVKHDLEFTQNWRLNALLIHWSHSSFMFRKQVIEDIGVWDKVVVGGDTEFIWRVQAKYGQEAVKLILKTVPMAFALDDHDSLTRNKATHVKTIHHGMRHIYRSSAEYWHEKRGSEELYKGQNDKTSFSVPLSMIERKNHSVEVDYLIINDFSEDKSSIDVVKFIEDKGQHTSFALLHWPRFGFPYGKLSERYFEVLNKVNVQPVVYGQMVSAEETIYTNDYFLRYDIDHTLEYKSKEVFVGLKRKESIDFRLKNEMTVHG